MCSQPFRSPTPGKIRFQIALSFEQDVPAPAQTGNCQTRPMGGEIDGQSLVALLQAVKFLENL